MASKSTRRTRRSPAAAARTPKTIADDVAEQLCQALSTAAATNATSVYAAWLTVVAVIGSLILQAYEVSERSKNASPAGAITEIKEGIQDLQHRLQAIDAKLDELSRDMAAMVAELKRYVDDVIYRNFVRQQFGELATARQTLETYFRSDALAYQNRAAIKDALLDIQKVVNTFLASTGGARLDEHLVIAGWVALWRFCWDTIEKICAANDNTYVVTDSSAHSFFRDYSQAVSALLQRCSVVAYEFDNWLLNTVLPIGGKTYKFDSGTRLFAPNGAFSIDVYYYQEPYRWNRGAAALPSGSSWAINPKLGVDASVALDSVFACVEVWAGADMRNATLRQISDAAPVLRQLANALKTP